MHLCLDKMNLLSQVYKAEKRGGLPLKVYNLWYSKSLESDRYMTALDRENTVFEDLIKQKAFIVFPEIAQVHICLSFSSLILLARRHMSKSLEKFPLKPLQILLVTEASG